MSIELVTKYQKYVDEQFSQESKAHLLTNQDFDFDGAHTVKIYKISTAEMNNYARNGYDNDHEDEVTHISRFGEMEDLSATTEYFTLSKDRSFIFVVDKLDMDETAGELAAGSALSRQIREVVMPEYDSYVYAKMAAGAGTIADPIIDYGYEYGINGITGALRIYDNIVLGSEVLDENMVPEEGRIIVVSSYMYRRLKQESIFDNVEVGTLARLQGVVGMIDGMRVVRIPSSRLPANFGFMICHPCATVAPIKLSDFGVHSDTPLASGDIVTGRFVYDAFVLDNKKKAIYYQEIYPSGATGATGATGSTGA